MNQGKALLFKLFLLLISVGMFAQEYPQNYFKAPLDIPLYLSGTFGEIRTNHFHSGIDFKTQGRTGLNVNCAAEGTVVRIKISPYGFGKAIYVSHPNGYTTVYAHLQSFNKEIEEYVRAQQYQKETFELELYPPSGKFQYAQGDLLAYSGNTGGSGGPHLHFEIRDSKTEKIINPLLFGFDIKDSQHPDLTSLVVYEFDDNELVFSESKSLLRINKGEYRLSGTGLVEVQNMPAFGIRTTDKLDGAPNKNGVYAMEYWVNDTKYYQFTANTFAFAESRYVNSHIDYAEKYCCNRTVTKLYLDPYNKFSGYGNTKPETFPALITDSVYKVRIVVKDFAGNESELKFELMKIESNFDMEETFEDAISIFSAGQSNLFKRESFQANIPEGALYTDVFASYEKGEPCTDCYSFIHKLASREIPVHKYYTLKIKPDGYFPGDKNKLAIASFKDGKLDDYEGGTWQDGFVQTRTRQFGEFAIMADTIAPRIQAINFRDGSDVSALGTLQIKITDEFSGIKSYRPTIDGQWVLFEYDAKNDLLTADISQLDIAEGVHQLQIEVYDDKGNVKSATFQLKF